MNRAAKRGATGGILRWVPQHLAWLSTCFIFIATDPRRHVLIPVMYIKCQVPDFISYLYYLDYPRYKDDPIRCERYFWERLYKAIQLPQT